MLQLFLGNQFLEVVDDGIEKLRMNVSFISNSQCIPNPSCSFPKVELIRKDKKKLVTKIEFLLFDGLLQRIKCSE